MTRFSTSTAVLITTVFFSLTVAHGQTDKEKAEQAQKRILLVPTEEGDTKQVTAYNERIKKIISKGWTFNDSIVFIPRSEVQKINEGGNDKYFIMDFRHIFNNNSNSLLLPLETTSNKKDVELEKWIFLYLSENKFYTLRYKNNKFLILQSKCDYWNEVKLAMEIKICQSFLLGKLESNPDKKKGRYDDIDKNHPLLFKKTLLIDTALLADKADTSKISEYYKYPFKISNKNEINNAIINSDERYAFIEITNYSGGLIHSIYDTEKGLILSCTPRRSSLGYKSADGVHLKNFKAYEIE